MYKEVEAKLENTIFEARIDENDNIISYLIRPAEGYRLHEVTLDEPVTDENDNDTNKVKLGYTKSYITASANYDFVKNNRKIYAKLDTEEDEIVDINFESYVNSGIEEKAKAYDILIGADE